MFLSSPYDRFFWITWYQQHGIIHNFSYWKRLIFAFSQGHKGYNNYHNQNLNSVSHLNQFCYFHITWQPVRGNHNAHEWILFYKISQSTVRCHWMSLHTVWLSHLQWLSKWILDILCNCFGQMLHLAGLSAPEPRCNFFRLLPMLKLLLKHHRHD